MLSNILKTNQIASGFLTVLLAIIAFLFVLANTNPFIIPSAAEGALCSIFLGSVKSRMCLYIVSFLFVASGAFIFNFYINSNETLSKGSFFSAFLFVLLSTEAFTSYAFHPAIVANTLVVVAIGRIMKSYRQDEAKSAFFDGAFLISFASLIYFPVITVFPLIFITILILRPFIWTEWASALLGVIAPHLIFTAFIYIFAISDPYYNKSFFVSFNVNSFAADLAWQSFLIFCLVFLFAIIIFQRIKGVASRKIRQQKNINILVLWLALGMLSVFYETPYKTSIPLLCVPPMAGLLSEWFGNFKRSSLSDFSLLLLLCAITLSVLQIRGFI